MPGEPDQRARINGGHLEKLLWRGLNADDPPVFKPQAVSGAQDRGSWKIEEKSGPAGGDVTLASPMPLIVGQYDAICSRIRGPHAGRKDFDCADGE